MRELNEQLELTNNWSKKWRIKTNADKSESIIFSHTLKPEPEIPPTFDGIPIPWKKKVKYLGVTLDKNLVFKEHIKNIRNKASGAINRLYPLLKSHSALGIKNGLLIYKMLIRPIMA